MLLLFAVSLQTFDLLLRLIKTIWQAAPFGLIKSSDQTDLPPFCLVHGGRQGIQQFITNSHGFRTPRRPKVKFSWEDFCRRTRTTGKTLAWYLSIKKEKAWCYFLASVLILLYRLHWSTFTIIFLCGKQLKSFSPKSIYLQQNNGSY